MDNGAAKVKLYASKKEQEMYESLADLFAIVKTTEKLERAYVRDAINSKDYEPLCQKLIAQFKTLWETLRDTVPDIQKFMEEYSMQCPMAFKRLVLSGLPATIEHGRPRYAQYFDHCFDKIGRTHESTNSAVAVAETVTAFITIMDSLKLNMVAVDQVFPLLNDVMHSMNKVAQLPPDFVGKEKTKAWIARVHNMPASHQLAEDEVRQMLMDFEHSYNAFVANLQGS